MKFTLKIFTAVGFLLVAQSAAPVFAELKGIASEFDSPEILGKDTDLLLYYAIFNSSILDPNASNTISENNEAKPCLDVASQENEEILALIKMRGAKMRECMDVKDDHMLEYFGTYGTNAEIFKEHFIHSQEDCSHRSAHRILDCYADTIATHLNKVNTDNYEIYSQYFWRSKFCIRSELDNLVENFIQEPSVLEKWTIGVDNLRCIVLLNEFPNNSSLNTDTANPWETTLSVRDLTTEGLQTEDGDLNTEEQEVAAVDYSDPQLPNYYPVHETPTTHKPHEEKKSWWDHIVSFWNWIWGN